MKNLLVLLSLLTAISCHAATDKIVSFTIPGYDGDFSMNLPSLFVTPATAKEEENRKSILASMNQMGGGQVEIVEIYQTNWNSKDAQFPMLTITSTPKIQSIQGNITEEMWVQMKQAYQGVSNQLFQAMTGENLEKKKQEGLIPVDYTKKDMELFFNSDDTSVSFMAEAEMEMGGKKGKAFSLTKLIYAKNCMIMLSLTVPTNEGIEKLSELVQAAEVN